MTEVYGVLRIAGASLSPFNAVVLLKGLAAVSLRMKAHSEQAFELAHWLEQQPGIERVHYCGLASHPQHALASQQQKAFGAVVSFAVKDAAGLADRAAAWRFIDATRVMSITANLGDTKHTITHPASTTHGRVPAEEKLRAGIPQNLIRVGGGLEGLDDLRADLARGIQALGFEVK